MITQSSGVLFIKQQNSNTTKVSQVFSFKHVYIYMWSWSLFQTPLKLPIDRYCTIFNRIGLLTLLLIVLRSFCLFICLLVVFMFVCLLLSVVVNALLYFVVEGTKMQTDH